MKDLERKIKSLRDDVTAHLMSHYMGNNRDLAMVLTKLDEAEGFAIRHGIATGRLALVNRAELLQAAQEAKVTSIVR